MTRMLHSAALRQILLASAVFGLGGGAVRAAAGGQEPTARQIVDRAVARAEQQRSLEAGAGFQAVVETTTEHLDGDGEVEKTERATYRVHPVEGVPFEELMARDGVPIDSEEARREADRRESFAREVRELRAKGEDPAPEDENSVRFDQEFVDRYRFWLVREEMVSGRPSWVIGLAPHEGDLPVRRRIDHALNRSTGTLWVDQEDYGLTRVEFEMGSPVRFWGGIIGTLRNTVGRLEFTRVDDGIWLPRLVDIRLDLRILFRNIRRRIVREWVEYAPSLTAD